MIDHDDLTAALARLLEPLAQILMARGLPHAAFANVAKFAYVRAAEADEGVPGRKLTSSRVSVLTGLTRREVARVRSTPLPPTVDAIVQHHRAARVISGWVRERVYLNGAGEPRDLPFDGAEPSFATLVARFGGDVPPRAVLDELVRVGTVSICDGGLITLRDRAYIPLRSEEQNLDFLKTDVAGLISTISHNLANPDDTKFQRRVYYDNLPEEALHDLKELTIQHGQRLLETLDKYMAQHDRDANPNVRGTGRKRAGIGVFYFDDDHDDAAESGNSEGS